jgi:hypothetical protein
MGERSFRDSSGKTWTVWMQEQDGSCAAASIYMAIAMRKLQTLAGGEKKYIAQMSSSGSTYADFLLGVGNRSMNQIGEIISRNGLKVSTNYASAEGLKGILGRASANRPVIVNVAWNDGGAHQIVCAGKSKALYIFLDPWFGLVEQDPAMFPNYAPQSGPASTAIAPGRFSGWYTQLL